LQRVAIAGIAQHEPLVGAIDRKANIGVESRRRIDEDAAVSRIAFLKSRRPCTTAAHDIKLMVWARGADADIAAIGIANVGAVGARAPLLCKNFLRATEQEDYC